MSRRTTTTPITRNKPSTMSTDFDDWETDPDFVREMGEMDQRWGGNARTAGSINMNQLIDDVRRDHQNMRERFQHPSQRDHSEGFGGKFGVQHDRKDQSALNYDYHEKLSKHTSQEITRKIITTSKSDLLGDDGKGGVSDARKTFLEKTQKTFSESRSPPPPLAVKPDFGDRLPFNTNKVTSSNDTRTSPNKAGQGARDMPQAFKSIQDKIDAFKKEFEEIENKVAKKADLSKVIKKTTNLENTSNVQYVSRSEGASASPISPTTTTSNFRPTSTSPLGRKDNNNSSPKTSIKSLSEKFETLYRDDGEDFKRKTEAKRKEFFDQIKHQVRETRKGLDGFDPIDDDIDDARYVSNRGATQNDTTSKPSYFKAGTTTTTSSMPTSTSPSSRPSSRLSQNSRGSKPKVYTRSEITREEVVSKLVKENDKVIENETKRNVERSSSCHGSSDDDDDQPTSIKHLDKTMRSSPLQGHTSPIDELKRKIPVVEPEIKGAGLMARTLFDYTAVEEDELTFDVDDLLTNIEKIDPGWYKGTITKGNIKKVGLFPANHVKLLNDDGEY